MVGILRYLLILIILSGIKIRAAQDKDMPHGNDFNINCENCHSTDDWLVRAGEIKFDHEETGYILLGEHAFIDCRSCHESLVFNRIGHACADCHTDVHAGELGIHCERCHTPVDWDNRLDIFKLHEDSFFPLVGVHAVLDCRACHTTENYNEFANTGVECKDCHLNDYMRTLNPVHQKSGFDLNCGGCHRPNLNNWENAGYVHTNLFPLIGGHAGLECIDCHENAYVKTPSDCFACHQNDYNNASEPDHLMFKFPTVCERCHDINTWTRADFDHLAESGFSLNGRHNSIQCLDCHVNNQLTGLPQDCYGCHILDYNSAEEPDHQQNVFSHNCLDCHNENAWSPAEFDHNQTDFPLTGAHISVSCMDCHTDGRYSGTAADCYTCHEQDYNNTTDPNHTAAQFPVVCTECHNTSVWEPAQWDHDGQYFPIYSGPHREEWNLCSDCHVDLSNYTRFECINCHEHNNRTEVDNDHDEAAGYTYQSAACYDCHPNGRSDDD